MTSLVARRCGTWRCPAAAGAQSRCLWTPETGYRPRADDPHRRPTLALHECAADGRLRRGHPWIFPREVRDPDALAAYSPCLVNVTASDGDVLGVALYNRKSPIAARMLSRQAFVCVDSEFFADRIRSCLAYREMLFPEPFYRLSHGEADGLPGLIIDRYGDHVVVQPTAAALDSFLWPIVDALDKVIDPKVIVIRQDAPGRRREKAPVKREVLKGQYVGPTELRENGVTFAVDLLGGQKTGWYYDHRDHRALLASLAPRTPRVLDLYSYAGGFGVTLAKYGAEEVVCVDSSEPALDLCRRAAVLNSVQGRVTQVKADVGKFLGLKGKADRDGSDAGETLQTVGPKLYDLVIVDPPNFGMSRENLPNAIRFYEKIIHAAIGACESPGMLFVASCTYHVGHEELVGATNRALSWAGRRGRLMSSGAQAADHPGHLALPESRYLRSLLLHLE